MPTVWVEFQTREESDRAIDRLELAGFERRRIDRIEAADGRWKVGIYVEERTHQVFAPLCRTRMPPQAWTC